MKIVSLYGHKQAEIASPERKIKLLLKSERQLRGKMKVENKKNKE